MLCVCKETVANTAVCIVVSCSQPMDQLCVVFVKKL